MSNSIALRKKYRMKRHSDGVISEKANAILQKVISAFQKLIVKLLKKSLIIWLSPLLPVI